MNDHQTNQATTGNGVAHERCLCYEILDLFRARLGVSPQVRQHLANSRIEFLKAIREVIDERIDHLSKPVQAGTKIRVE
jgi:hypothetical protein